jgi:hypothetical protein
MADQRLILEMGTGNDLYGGDYTKAAVRAVHDAMRHSSLSLYWSLGLDPAQMRVNITIGVQQPDQVDVPRSGPSDALWPDQREGGEGRAGRARCRAGRQDCHRGRRHRGAI